MSIICNIFGHLKNDQKNRIEVLRVYHDATAYAQVITECCRCKKSYVLCNASLCNSSKLEAIVHNFYRDVISNSLLNQKFETSTKIVKKRKKKEKVIDDLS